MSINSISFVFFFAVVFAFYYLPVFKSASKYQNIVLFVASYTFYAFSDLRMMTLLFGATVVFYYLGLWLKNEIDKERWGRVTTLTIIGVVIGVGILLYFKYLNFFAESIAETLSLVGIHATWTSLNIILPVGVSFFTFKLISYILEINKEGVEPTRDFIEFGTYIAFFPTIMAGPIDRPNKFIPQLEGTRFFDYSLAVDGCRQILWGAFAKMCVADNLASITEAAWSNIGTYGSFNLLIVMLVSPIQLYADFSGYSDIAIGVSKLLGLRVAKNFDHPFFSRNIAEFWRKWHMSLTSWVTDYVYTPLCYYFRSYGRIGIIIAIFINLLVLGLWHGAAWKFVFFGLYHAVLFTLYILFNESNSRKKDSLPVVKYISVLITYFVVSIGVVLFSAPTMADACFFYYGVFSNSHFGQFSLGMSPKIIIILSLFISLGWSNRHDDYALALNTNGIFKHRVARYCFYYLIVILIIYFHGVNQKFVYFEF